jgi:hypothetical protein
VWWVLVLAAVVIGCPAPKQYAVARSGLTCERATRVAYRAMIALGYTVTDLVPATPTQPGLVAGTKPGPEGTPLVGRVRIRCDAGGAEVQPIEEALMPSYDFSRLFGYSFTTLVQQPDVDEPRAATGLQVQLHALDAHEALLDLRGTPTQGGAVAVRITIRNNSDRAVAIDPVDVELVAAGGASAAPLSGSAFDAALAPGAAGDRVRAERLTRAEIPAHTTVTRFLVYPPGAYGEARLTITDVETGESEGLVAPVQ